MALASRSIYESLYRMQRSSQGNGEMVLRGKDVSGMEVNRFRLASLDSWKTCVPLSHSAARRNLITLFVAGSGKSILWFVEYLPFFVKNN